MTETQIQHIGRPRFPNEADESTREWIIVTKRFVSGFWLVLCLVGIKLTAFPQGVDKRVSCEEIIHQSQFEHNTSTSGNSAKRKGDTLGDGNSNTKEKKDSMLTGYVSNTTILQENKELRIVHIVSPFQLANCEGHFCPFGQEQSVSLSSMLRAKAQSSSHVNVTLAAVSFPEDEHLIPEGFWRLPSLNRSTLSEYPHINGTKKLPFLQDIFDRLLASTDMIGFDYVVYTNADIILHENFYNLVTSKIEEGLDTFTINRRTVAKKGKDGVFYTNSDLEKIFELRGLVHPGYDCFIFPRHILAEIDVGNTFLGIPPLSLPLLVYLQYTPGIRYKAYPTRFAKATYHLGDDRSWDPKWGWSPEATTMRRKDPYWMQNYANVFELTRVWSLCGSLLTAPRTHKAFACNELNQKTIAMGFDTRAKCAKWSKECNEFYEKKLIIAS